MSRTQKTLLIIGGSGFMGSALIAACKDWKIINYDLVPFSRENSRPENFRDLVASGNLEDDLKEVFPEISAVWIRAGKTGGGSSTKIQECSAYLETNTELVRKVTNLCAQFGCQKIFYDSSEQVFGNSGDHFGLFPETEPFPLNFYGVSKVVSEKILYQWAQEGPERSVQIFRYSRVRGAMTRDVIRFMVSCCVNGEPIPLTVDPGHRISFVHINDVTNANLRSLDLSPKFACYHVSSGRPVSLFELATRVQEIFGQRVGISIKEKALPPDYEPYVVGMDWEKSREILGLPFPLSLDCMIEETFQTL